MPNKQEILQKLKTIRKESEEMLVSIQEIEDDLLFVVYDYEDAGFGLGTQDFYDWFYENNIVGKLENFDFSLQGMLHLHMVGFRFKHEADATAFKLRWT